MITAPCPKCNKCMNGRYCIGYGGSCDYVATDIEADLLRRIAETERQRDELLAALRPFAEYDYADVELKQYPQPQRDTFHIGVGHNSPTYGDCRRAAELIASIEHEKGK